MLAPMYKYNHLVLYHNLDAFTLVHEHTSPRTHPMETSRERVNSSPAFPVYITQTDSQILSFMSPITTATSFKTPSYDRDSF